MPYCFSIFNSACVAVVFNLPEQLPSLRDPVEDPGLGHGVHDAPVVNLVHAAEYETGERMLGA